MWRNLNVSDSEWMWTVTYKTFVLGLISRTWWSSPVITWTSGKFAMFIRYTLALGLSHILLTHTHMNTTGVSGHPTLPTVGHGIRRNSKSFLGPRCGLSYKPVLLTVSPYRLCYLIHVLYSAWKMCLSTAGRFYTVSQKKLCKLIFLSELCQISTDYKNFWHKDSKKNRLFRGILIFHLT